MALIKTVVLPTAATASYHIIKQISLPSWAVGGDWEKGVIFLDRYASKAAFEAGAQPFDQVAVSLVGTAFLALRFENQDILLETAYQLLLDRSVEYGDAELADLPSEGGVYR